MLKEVLQREYCTYIYSHFYNSTLQLKIWTNVKLSHVLKCSQEKHSVMPILFKPAESKPPDFRGHIGFYLWQHRSFIAGFRQKCLIPVIPLRV